MDVKTNIQFAALTTAMLCLILAGLVIITAGNRNTRASNRARYSFYALVASAIVLTVATALGMALASTAFSIFLFVTAALCDIGAIGCWISMKRQSVTQIGAGQLRRAAAFLAGCTIALTIVGVLMAL